MKDRNSPAAKRMTQARSRDLDALEMRIGGATYAEISKALGITIESARQCILRANEALMLKIEEKAAELRQMEITRLDAMQAGVWDNARSGDVQAIDAVLKIMKQRERYVAVAIAQPKPVEPESEGDKGQPVTITYTMAARST